MSVGTGQKSMSCDTLKCRFPEDNEENMKQNSQQNLYFLWLLLHHSRRLVDKEFWLCSIKEIIGTFNIVILKVEGNLQITKRTPKKHLRNKKEDIGRHILNSMTDQKVLLFTEEWIVKVIVNFWSHIGSQIVIMLNRQWKLRKAWNSED